MWDVNQCFRGILSQHPQNIFYLWWERSGKCTTICSFHYTHWCHSQKEMSINLLFGHYFNVCSHPWEPVEASVILNMACFGSWFHSFWRQSNQLTLIYIICQWKLFTASTARTLPTSVFFRAKHQIWAALYTIPLPCTKQFNLLEWGQFPKAFLILQEVQNDFKNHKKVLKYAFNVSVAIRSSPSLVNLSMVSIKQVIWYVSLIKSWL